jgi:hypothetical protein
MKKTTLLTLSFVLVSLFLISCQSKDETTTSPTTTPPNFKVAFIGDQGLGGNSRAVLQLIKDEGADMVLHQGDFDYRNKPDKWDEQISDVLGPNFPYFASIGNHDVRAWAGYQKKLQARLERIKGATCHGDLGIKSACIYKGLFFILSGAGTMGSGHDAYIRGELARDNSLWRICSWHKNQRLMQVGDKEDEVGWGPYEECRKGGAIIATAHSHYYVRTHLMDNFETQSVASTSNTLRIEKGNSLVLVSGLGGHGVESQKNSGLAANDWWAAVYTREQGANYGALFCVFNEGGVENKAHCYFKDIDGKIPDEFDIVSDVR